MSRKNRQKIIREIEKKRDANMQKVRKSAFNLRI